jgi:4-hydroxy-tetrahydrodipicolinate synthase
MWTRTATRGCCAPRRRAIGRPRAEHERLLRVFNVANVGGPQMGRSSSALGAFKVALQLRGIIDHPTTALPQIPLDSSEIAQVDKYLTDAALL